MNCDYITEPDIHFTNAKQQCWESTETTHYDKKDGVWYINGSRFRLPEWSDQTIDEVLTYLMSCKGLVERPLKEQIANY